MSLMVGVLEYSITLPRLLALCMIGKAGDRQALIGKLGGGRKALS